MRRLAWAIPASLGLVMGSLAAVHLFFPASRMNGVFSTLPVVAHGLAFPLPGGATLALAGTVAILPSVGGNPSPWQPGRCHHPC